MSPTHERRRADSNAADSQPIRLLAVEDDENYRAYITALARRAGFAVDSVGDADTALGLLGRGGYDAAIIDHEMPRATGIELIAAIRAGEATRSIYALMLTGHEDVETKLASLKAGFDDFLAKSSTDAEITAKLIAARRIAARQRTMSVAMRELYGLATRDELTGVFNRRFFVNEAERLLDGDTVLNVILFDVDSFKQVNDTHGHAAGDGVLRDVAALFHRNTRPEDIVARIGGDEFVMAIPDLSRPEIELIAMRLSREVQTMEWHSDDARFTIGISFGVASSRDLNRPTLAQLLEAADRDMYRHKRGRKARERRSAAMTATPAPS